MPMDRFIIAPFETGLQTNVRPWLVADDAFAYMRNAYVFRGRVRKRFGSRYTGAGWANAATQQLNSRVSIQVGTTSGIGGLAGTVPGAVFAVGQMFSIGTQMYTVQATGTPVTMLTTGAGSGTYNTTTGAYVFVGAPINTPVYFYPATPIMGLTQYQTGPINQQPSYAFDTQFAYLFSGGAWTRSGTSVWHGTDTNFFWSATFRGSNQAAATLFTSNFYAVNPNGAGNANDDPIWWTQDGTNWISGTGNNAFYFLPAPGDPPVPQARYTGPYIKTAKIILPYKQNRLLLFNTIENDNPNGDGSAGTNTNYPSRVRYSHNGNPFAQNAWYEYNQSDSSNTGTGGSLSRFDGGGFLDAPTTESIVSAQYIKDRLIVFFESSTWELVSRGTSFAPFEWQKINTELGSESQQSSVPFDKVILTVGNVGIHGCNGANVERVDNKIPQEVFDISDTPGGTSRIAGIRDYFVEMVYWSYVADDQASNQPYPQRVLVYNYRNQSWAINDDCITAFGYFNSQDAQTWEETTDTWEETNQTWESGSLEANFRQVIAGNQQGYIFIVDADAGRNAQVMQISNIVISSSNSALTITCVNHMLVDFVNGGFVEIQGVQGMTNVNGLYPVYNVVNAHTFTVLFQSDATPPTGTYTGGGTIARVSQIDIYSKQWNPYDKIGKNVFVSKIDFSVTNTVSGQVMIDYYPSSSNFSMPYFGGPLGSNMLLGTSVLETSPYALYPLEQQQARLWHPVYFQTDGECIQIRIYLNEQQMTNPAIVYSDFELHGLVLHTISTSDRLQ